MRKLKGLTFAALVALSLAMSTSPAFAKDAKHGRETAWTDVGGPAQFGPIGDFSEGVTWE